MPCDNLRSPSSLILVSSFSARTWVLTLTEYIQPRIYGVISNSHYIRHPSELYTLSACSSPLLCMVAASPHRPTVGSWIAGAGLASRLEDRGFALRHARAMFQVTSHAKHTFARSRIRVFPCLHGRARRAGAAIPGTSRGTPKLSA